MTAEPRSPMSHMSSEDKEFFSRLLDIIKRYHRQREALVQILREYCENWEPIYHVLQDDTQIVGKANELFAEMYESIGLGRRDSETLSKFSKELPIKARPN